MVWHSCFGFAVLTYSGLLYFSFQVVDHRSARTFFRVFGFMAGFAALWFMFLQFFVLEKLCPYCIAVHLCGLTIAALVFFCGSLSKRKFSEGGFGWAAKPIALAGIGMLILIGGQFAYAPPEMLISDLSDQAGNKNGLIEAVKSPAAPSRQIGGPSNIEEPAALDVDYGGHSKQNPIPGDIVDSTKPPAIETSPPSNIPTSNTRPNSTPTTTPKIELPTNDATSEATTTTADPVSNPTPAAGNLSNNTAAQPRNNAPEVKTVSRFERVGPANVNVAESILIGDPDAEEIIVEMVDYSCSKCRKAHRQLEKFKKISTEPFSTLLILVPLNSSCNPHIRLTHPNNVDSCRYTKLAMVVWETNREVFPAFHTWMMQGDVPPDFESAKKYVEKVIPNADIIELMNRAELTQKIRANTDVYLQTGTGKLPRFYINEHSILGVPSNDRQMFSALKDLLARQ